MWRREINKLEYQLEDYFNVKSTFSQNGKSVWKLHALHFGLFTLYSFLTLYYWNLGACTVQYYVVLTVCAFCNETRPVFELCIVLYLTQTSVLMGPSKMSCLLWFKILYDMMVKNNVILHALPNSTEWSYTWNQHSNFDARCKFRKFPDFTEVCQKICDVRKFYPVQTKRKINLTGNFQAF